MGGLVDGLVIPGVVGNPSITSGILVGELKAFFLELGRVVWEGFSSRLEREGET